jgi:hypothetical protein
LGEWLALRKSSDGQWQVASLGRQPNER